VINITKTTVLWVICSAFSLVAKAQEITIYKAKKIYLCDTSFAVVEAMAVSGNKIVLTGTYDSAIHKYPNARTVHFKNKFIYPGLIDAHCHFYATANGMSECNLVGSKSEADVISKLKKFKKTNKRTWIVGRGWDQNEWKGGQYPTLEALDKAFPNTPVFLKRIDGHAAWINTAAIQEAAIDITLPVDGGEILKRDGKFTGILVDNAVDLVAIKVPDNSTQQKIENLNKLQKQCFANGLTTIDDAGLTVQEMQFLDSLQNEKILNMRIYAMLSSSPATYSWIATNGIYQTDYMHVASVKFYLDGAMGSRGALMKNDYCDRPGHRGLLLTKPDDFLSSIHYLYTAGYQVCVHAIGDSANSMALQNFRKIMPPRMDLRWRIEHAQITDPADFKLYKNYSIIPSIQPTHATSDANWVGNRYCKNGMDGAYAYHSLLGNAGIVALGTDFPVEDISPFKTFYSAVTRLDAAGKLKTPFLPAEALTRQEAILGMTIWAAIANLEEKVKGSLETGKLADFVVLNQDLMTVANNKIMKTKPVATFLGNQQVYKK